MRDRDSHRDELTLFDVDEGHAPGDRRADRGVPELPFRRRKPGLRRREQGAAGRATSLRSLVVQIRDITTLPQVLRAFEPELRIRALRLCGQQLRPRLLHGELREFGIQTDQHIPRLHRITDGCRNADDPPACLRAHLNVVRGADGAGRGNRCRRRARREHRHLHGHGRDAA